MSYITKLVDRATSTKNKKPLKVGNYSATTQDGGNCYVTHFYHKDEYFATLTVDRPSTLGVTLGIYKRVSCGAELMKAIKDIYPNMVDHKEF